MKVYIAGPIAGYEDGNRKAFSTATVWLMSYGHEPVNPHEVPPHEHEGECPPGPKAEEEHNAPCYMRTDIIAMLGCDAVYFLKGWEKSSGAFAELTAARAAGLELWFEGANGAVRAA